MATPNQSVDISAGLVPIQGYVPPAANNPASTVPSSSAAPSSATPNQPARPKIDISAGLVPIDQYQAPEPPVHEQPGFFDRVYQTSGIKGMVDAAKARADEDEAVRNEAAGHLKAHNWGQAAEILLSHIAKRAANAPGVLGPGLDAISGTVNSTLEHGKAAYQAARTGDTGKAVEEAATAVPVVGPAVAQVAKPLGEDIGKRNWSGAAGDVVSGGIQGALALAGGKAAEGGEVRSAMSAEETASKGLPLKEAGQQIQSEARAVRSAKGAELGGAKEALKKTLPEGQMPYPENGQAATVGKKVLDEIGTSKLGLKDPDMAEVESLAKQFTDGKTADGEPLSYNMEEAEAEKRALNAKIDSLQTKVLQGANGSALRHLKNLRAGFTDDLYDMYEQHGDAAAAQSVRSLGREYAKIVDDQTSGPAKAMLRNASPEKIVSTIVSNGAKSQSAVESLVRNMSDEGQATLRDSVLKEIYRKNTLPDGTIDMAKAQKAFNGMGDSAKTLFGDSHADTSKFLDAAAREQAAKTVAANKPSLLSKMGAKGVARMTGAGVGAAAGGPVGAIVGDVVADSLFQQGKSGAVKIGISPTERIVLSPSAASANRGLLTQFLKTKAAGQSAAMVSAYNALAKQNGDNQADSGDQNQPSSSTGGSPIGSILAGEGRL
jgi:hypothetical protein